MPSSHRRSNTFLIVIIVVMFGGLIFVMLQDPNSGLPAVVDALGRIIWGLIDGVVAFVKGLF